MNGTKPKFKFEVPDGMYLKGYKIKIYPNETEKKIIDRNIDLKRYVYNWAINEEYENYNLWLADMIDRRMKSKFDLYRMYTEFKQKPGQEFLKDFPIDAARSAIDAAYNSFNRYFKHLSRKPKFRSKKQARTFVSYGIRSDRLFFKGKYVRVPGLKKGTKIYTGIDSGFSCQKDNPTYYNSFVSRDKLGNYWLSFKTMEKRPTDYFEINNIPEMEQDNGVLGIDLNKSPRFACSDRSMYYAPNISRLEFKKKELQRKIKKDIDRRMKEKQEKTNPEDVQISKRSEKRLIKLRKVEYRIRGINNNFIHTTTKQIINKHPKMIVMENLRISDMVKNKYAASNTNFHYASFYKCRYIMQQKCEMYGVKFVLVPRSYPSSQLCSSCGHRLKKNFSKDRSYTCPKCGTIINRDLNAAYNLRNYGLQLLE